VEALQEVVASAEQEAVVSVVPVLLEAAASAQAEAAHEAVALAEKEEAIFQSLTHVDQKALFLIAQKVEHQASVPLAKLNAFYC
jgi:hypothetical protein